MKKKYLWQIILFILTIFFIAYWSYGQFKQWKSDLILSTFQKGYFNAINDLVKEAKAKENCMPIFLGPGEGGVQLINTVCLKNAGIEIELNELPKHD
ncbi:hypothetical protein JW752_00100 [Candidatus Peregrinibacteria bacterium]|nr:hypothetical protein [Candidatus Peregrinibacteria bacterium]